MKVIESFIQGKKPDPALCEDRILVTGDFVAVFDGVTTVGGAVFDGHSPGRFAAEVLAHELAQLPADIEALPAVRHLSKTLIDKTAAEAARNGADVSDIWAHPASCMLVYSRARHEIWRVGDSTFSIDGVETAYELPIAEVWKPLRQAFIHAELIRGKTEAEILAADPSWPFLVPLIQHFKPFANNSGPWGYSVFNGLPVAENKVGIFKVPEGARDIVLASDGYLRVFMTLQETEAHLQEALAADPLLYKHHPQVRGLAAGQLSYDDRSYVRIAL